jgi:hypothetical protein
VANFPGVTLNRLSLQSGDFDNVTPTIIIKLSMVCIWMVYLFRFINATTLACGLVYMTVSPIGVCLLWCGGCGPLLCGVVWVGVGGLSGKGLAQLPAEVGNSVAFGAMFLVGDIAMKFPPLSGFRLKTLCQISNLCCWQSTDVSSLPKSSLRALDLSFHMGNGCIPSSPKRNPHPFFHNVMACWVFIC